MQFLRHAFDQIFDTHLISTFTYCSKKSHTANFFAVARIVCFDATMYKSQEAKISKNERKLVILFKEMLFCSQLLNIYCC